MSFPLEGVSLCHSRLKESLYVIPAQAGIQISYCYFLDSGFRRNDDIRL